jgi:hypothetical protein
MASAASENVAGRPPGVAELTDKRRAAPIRGAGPHCWYHSWYPKQLCRTCRGVSLPVQAGHSCFVRQAARPLRGALDGQARGTAPVKSRRSQSVKQAWLHVQGSCIVRMRPRRRAQATPRRASGELTSGAAATPRSPPRGIKRDCATPLDPRSFAYGAFTFHNDLSNLCRLV